MENFPPPPPPPPHGEMPRSSGLPRDGKYDIFIIPPHSAGGGFIYLPSMKANVPSFAAGFASALIIVVVASMLKPAFQQWWSGLKGGGGSMMVMLIIAIALGAWAVGRTQADGGPGPGGGGPPPPPPRTGAHSGANGFTNGGTPGAGGGAGAYPGANGYANGSAPGPQPGAQHGPPPAHQHGAASAGGEPPKSSWQQPEAPPGAANANASAPKNAAKEAWEKAREETKKKEEERKAKEADKKKKEDLEKRLKEMREKDAREREAREKVAKDKIEKEIREKLAKETAEKEAREARLKDMKLRAEARQKAASEQKAAKDGESKPAGSTYAFSAVGEKTNPWPRGQPASPAARSQPSSPTKRPPAPTANTYLGTDEDAHSYRPYDKPKPKPKNSHSSLYSESSYAASQSTSRTTPPPSNRGPYSTKDPDKIVIKAVYSFNNAFLKTPTSQLVSGVGSVTDGLILRITTEGLFIDDDVRHVPQREWDVKAWTMKLVEVWCPSFRGDSTPQVTRPSVSSSGFPFKQRRLWGLDKEKPATSEETDALLAEMAQLCRDNCRSRAPSPASPSSSAYSASSAASSSRSDTSYASSSYASSSAGSSSPSWGNNKGRTDIRGAHQTGEHKSARLHILRTSIRDQEGKKWLFVIPEEESWKVATGLQRLRKSAQVRALGVSGMSSSDARGTLENLGWV